MDVDDPDLRSRAGGRARKNLLSTCKIRCDQDLINSAARSSSYLVDLSQQEERKSFGFEACDRTALLSGLLRIGISIRINAFVQSRHVLESPRFVRRYLEPTWLVHDAGRLFSDFFFYAVQTAEKKCTRKYTQYSYEKK